MRKIVNGVYMLSGGRGDSHVYILNDNDGYILIDTGRSDKISKIDPRIVKMVILTHSHYDHIGQAWRFTNVYCSSKAFQYITEWREDIITAGKNEKIKRFVPTGLLRNNEIIRTNNFLLRIFYTPSHTDDSIVIFEEKKKLLFTGDVLFAMGIVGRTNLINSVKENVDRVIRKIYSLPYKYLLPGHGPIEKRVIMRV